eukprot:scaffold25095_cov51-Attheya_sp.AAC.6
MYLRRIQYSTVVQAWYNFEIVLGWTKRAGNGNGKTEKRPDGTAAETAQTSRGHRPIAKNGKVHNNEPFFSPLLYKNGLDLYASSMYRYMYSYRYMP